MKAPDILYEDAHIIVCLKPAGIPSQSGRSRTPDMVSQLQTALLRRERTRYNPRTRNQPPYIAVVHRLDQPVGGIMVYAKSRKAAAGLSEQLRSHQFSKHYKAIISCRFPETSAPSGTLTDYLTTDPLTNLSKIVPENTSETKQAVLTYQLEQVHPELPLSLLDIQLMTGRHHQIRAQMAHHFAPLLGDVKYGFCDNGLELPLRPGEIGLFACHLAFTHPVSGKEMCFEHLPKDWMNGCFPSA